MKLPDTNVLVHAVNRDSPAHASAVAWLTQAFDDTAGVALAWVALLGFIRISTRRGILAQPLTLEQALAVTNQWLDHPHAHVLNPGARHAGLLGRLLSGAGAAGNLTTDAHLAALAIEHRATPGSFDHDFERFAGLDFELLR